MKLEQLIAENARVAAALEFQADILKEVPPILQELAQDQIAEIRRQTNALVAALEAIRRELPDDGAPR